MSTIYKWILNNYRQKLLYLLHYIKVVPFPLNESWRHLEFRNSSKHLKVVILKLEKEKAGNEHEEVKKKETLWGTV